MSELTIFEMRHISPDVAAWLSLEISQDNSVVFVGGSESLSLSNGDGFVFAVNFKSELEVVASKRYGENDGKIGCVNLIRRYYGSTSDNLLLLGGSGAILVVCYISQAFHTIQTIQSFTPNPICDLAVQGNNLYAVSGLRKILCCFFDPKAAELQKKVEVELQNQITQHMIKNAPSQKDRLEEKPTIQAVTNHTTMTHTPYRRLNFNEPVEKNEEQKIPSFQPNQHTSATRTVAAYQLEQHHPS